MIRADVIHKKDGKPETATVWFDGALPRPGDLFVMHGDREVMDYHYRVKHVLWNCHPGGPGGDRAAATIDVDQCFHREARNG